jgi:hypothetical protein
MLRIARPFPALVTLPWDLLVSSDPFWFMSRRLVRVMSVIHVKTDIHQRGLHVRLVPQTDIDGPEFAGRIGLR